MNKRLFKSLCSSLEEAGKIQRGEAKPSRSYIYAGTSAKAEHKNETLEEMSERLSQLRTESLKKMAQTFTGIPVILDTKLKGTAYYLCVSQELLDELKKQKEVDNGNHKAIIGQ